MNFIRKLFGKKEDKVETQPIVKTEVVNPIASKPVVPDEHKE